MGRISVLLAILLSILLALSAGGKCVTFGTIVPFKEDVRELFPDNGETAFAVEETSVVKTGDCETSVN